MISLLDLLKNLYEESMHANDEARKTGSTLL